MPSLTIKPSIVSRWNLRAYQQKTSKVRRIAKLQRFIDFSLEKWRSKGTRRISRFGQDTEWRVRIQPVEEQPTFSWTWTTNITSFPDDAKNDQWPPSIASAAAVTSGQYRHTSQVLRLVCLKSGGSIKEQSIGNAHPIESFPIGHWRVRIVVKGRTE